MFVPVSNGCMYLSGLFVSDHVKSLLLFRFVRCLCRLEPALSGDKAMQGMPGVQDVQGVQGMPRSGTGPGTVKTWKQQTMDSACTLHG